MFLAKTQNVRQKNIGRVPKFFLQAYSARVNLKLKPAAWFSVGNDEETTGLLMAAS
jgi:hypothetical protein